jgi:hypothetical protein
MSAVIENKIKVNMKIRPHKKYTPPEPNNKNLPPLFFSLLSSSVKNSGKTWNIIELITAYENSGITQDGEKCEIRTIWFSGSTATSENNSIIRTLKSLDLDDIHDIDRLSVDKFREVYEEALNEKQDIEKYMDYERAWKKYKKEGERALSDLDLLILDERDYVAPSKLQDKPKYKRPRIIFWVMDDLLGNPLVFGYRKDNFVNNIIIKHRHSAKELVPINLILISQNFKSVSTIVRKNIDIFVLLKNANKQKLLENVSNEVGGIVGIEDLTTLYDYATSFEYGSLIINTHPKEMIRFRRGWATEIKLEEWCDCVSKGKPAGSCGKKQKV